MPNYEATKRYEQITDNDYQQLPWQDDSLPDWVEGVAYGSLAVVCVVFLTCFAYLIATN